MFDLPKRAAHDGWPCQVSCTVYEARRMARREKTGHESQVEGVICAGSFVTSGDKFFVVLFFSRVEVSFFF
jgi:hypothetical protein